jgi:hypothetical protein
LLDTLHLNENIEVIIPQPFTVHSLEEFFAIRTHIFNAIQFEQSKRPIDLDKLTKLPIEKKKINLRVQSQSEDLDSSEKPNPLIVLTRSENNEEGTIEYSITDNITRFWRPKLVVKAWRAYQHGLNCPNLPLVSKKGGMIMSAFLAGQRAAKSGYADKNIYRPSFEIDPVNKSKSVTLRFAR